VLVTTPWWQELFGREEGVGYRAFQAEQVRRGRLAVVAIDVVRSFVGTPGLTLAETVAEWPAACGPHATEALASIRALFTAARAAGVPIVHVRPLGDAAMGSAVKLRPATVSSTCWPGGNDFVPESMPAEGEIVLGKAHASAFFDTPLATHLRGQGIGSVLAVGATTSGCVRATVVDAFSHGFSTYVVEDAVFDRSRLSAGVSLYEMDARYADVVTLDEARGMILETSAERSGA
jgi:nicotinamidase-related amidase